MLQPLQIQDVSVRYANEIAELRDFLAKAGLRLDTAATLQSVTRRLREDRSFRRDLTSHVWVVLHDDSRQVSRADLLAMLAVAATGPQLAAEAGDTEAHDLLRYVMQAWNAFGASPRGGSATAPLGHAGDRRCIAAPARCPANRAGLVCESYSLRARDAAIPRHATRCGRTEAHRVDQCRRLPGGGPARRRCAASPCSTERRYTGAASSPLLRQMLLLRC